MIMDKEMGQGGSFLQLVLGVKENPTRAERFRNGRAFIRQHRNIKPHCLNKGHAKTLMFTHGPVEMGGAKICMQMGIIHLTGKKNVSAQAMIVDYLNQLLIIGILIIIAADKKQTGIRIKSQIHGKGFYQIMLAFVGNNAADKQNIGPSVLELKHSVDRCRDIPFGRINTDGHYLGVTKSMAL